MLGGTAVAWPLAAGAQHRERMRRIGVLMTIAAGQFGSRSRLTVLPAQAPEKLGWVDGRNMRDGVPLGPRRRRAFVAEVASELVGARPRRDPCQWLRCGGGTLYCRLHARCRSYSCLFPDPVAAGYVYSLARPGGNATGIVSTEHGMGGKWLELLKQIVPQSDASGSPA